MKHAVVEKRIAGIIRWLERLNKSYSTGKMESALMEAECAKADLETLRRDVWANIQPEEIRERRFIPGFMAVLRPAFLAVLIVAFAVSPVARDIPAAVVPVAAESEAVEPVAAEPVITAQAVQTVQETPTVAPKPETLPKKQQPRKIAAVKKPAASTASVKTEPTDQKTSKTVAYDKVFSLMQTGQRALKNNTSVIKVQ